MITKFPTILRASAVSAVVASLTLTSATAALAASPKAKKDSASAALVPAKYKSGIKVATDATYPPDEFVNAAGKIVGNAVFSGLATAGKLCGAGGGGHVLLIAARGKWEELRASLPFPVNASRVSFVDRGVQTWSQE